MNTLNLTHSGKATVKKSTVDSEFEKFDSSLSYNITHITYTHTNKHFCVFVTNIFTEQDIFLFN